jgi:hypothetical protein
MTSKPLIEVALRLTGQGFSPDDVTALVQLAPTKTWRLGDVVQGTILRRKHDGWVFGLPQRHTYDMDAYLRELLDLVEPCRNGMAKAVKRFALKKEISFAVYIKQQTPTCWFGTDTLRRLSALGADLDIDIMLVG